STSIATGIVSTARTSSSRNSSVTAILLAAWALGATMEAGARADFALVGVSSDYLGIVPQINPSSDFPNIGKSSSVAVFAGISAEAAVGGWGRRRYCRFCLACVIDGVGGMLEVDDRHCRFCRDRRRERPARGRGVLEAHLESRWGWPPPFLPD